MVNGSPLCTADDNSSGVLGPAPWYGYIMTQWFIYCVFCQKFQNFINSELIARLPQTLKAFWMELLKSGPSPLLLVHFLYSYLVQILTINSSSDIHAKSKKYSFFYFQVVTLSKSGYIYFLKKTMCYSKKSRGFGMRHTLNLTFDGFWLCNLSQID